MEQENSQNRFEERNERRKKDSREAVFKTVIGLLVVVALCLGGVLWYVSRDHNKVVAELNLDKEELTRQMIELQGEYDALTSSYTYINSQLDSSKEQVAQLIERIRKTDAVNRSRMRQYEKELGTLRSIMKHYVHQIDSLNTLNKRLTAEAASARKEAAQVKKENEQMSQKISDLTGKVAAGSVLKSRSVRLEACTHAGKPTERYKSAESFQTTVTIIANDLAPKVWTRIYIVVTDADGNVIFGSDNPSGEKFDCNGECLVASASREIDYQGAEIDVTIFLNGVTSFAKGIYTVEVFTQAGSLGKAETMLR